MANATVDREIQVGSAAYKPNRKNGRWSKGRVTKVLKHAYEVTFGRGKEAKTYVVWSFDCSRADDRIFIHKCTVKKSS